MRVTLEHVSKRYGKDTLAVDDISFTADDREFVVLLGESGCGKTTTLKLINRLIEPTAGRIRFDKQDVTDYDAVELRRSVGYVFQQVGLFPHMTIGENVAVTPTLLGWNAERIAAKVDELLELAQLPADEYRDRMPDEISGGQQQRVGFARALAAEPSVILLDEPFGALDPLTRDQLRGDFHAIQRELSLTAIMVTHDMTEALLLADRIIVIRDGKIIQNGSPQDLMARPADDYVQELLSSPLRQTEQIDALLSAASEAPA